MRVLLLGGTTEANHLARALSGAGVDAVYSYAGRTAAPPGQPIATRSGGFGGIEGLAAYLKADAITHVIDATHPFAAQMGANAAAACATTGTPLLRLERPAWVAGPGDAWTHVPDVEAAADALPNKRTAVFLAIGRQRLEVFARQPQHRYLLRLVDPPEAPLPLPDAVAIIARGPFDEAADRALMQAHGVQVVVAKNAGGQGAEAKLAAARALGIPLILIDRPTRPAVETVAAPEEALAWCHRTDLGV